MLAANPERPHDAAVKVILRYALALEAIRQNDILEKMSYLVLINQFCTKYGALHKTS